VVAARGDSPDAKQGAQRSVRGKLRAGASVSARSVPAALRTETPDALFDREWALAVIERSLTSIE